MNTTELNRAIAKAKGLRESNFDGLITWFHKDRPGIVSAMNGAAWADSADVALRELWPEVCRSMTVSENYNFMWVLVPEDDDWSAFDASKAIAIEVCRAWLKMKGVEVD